MNYYLTKILRLKETCFSNQNQIDLAIAAKNYIHRHYDENLSLDLIARDHSISKYHLIRVFKRYYGITPGQYLINLRINQAKKLLKLNFSVRDTCFQVGFESASSFSTLFKRKTGCPPSAFQNEQFSQSEFPIH